MAKKWRWKRKRSLWCNRSPSWLWYWLCKLTPGIKCIDVNTYTYTRACKTNKIWISLMICINCQISGCDIIHLQNVTIECSWVRIYRISLYYSLPLLWINNYLKIKNYFSLLIYTLKRKALICFCLPIPPFSSPTVITVAVFLPILPEIVCGLSI